MIDRATVEHIARLARLSFTDEQANRLQGELGDILRYVEQLAAVPLEDDADTDAGADSTAATTAATITMTPATAGGRPDEPHPSAPRDRVMELSPDLSARERGMFVVPGVLDDRVADDASGEGAGS